VANYVVEETGAVKPSTVKEFAVRLGPVENSSGRSLQWLGVQATKGDQTRFEVWLSCERFPSDQVSEAESAVGQYILQEGAGNAVEFSDLRRGHCVLPVLGAWPYLLPRAIDNPRSFDPTAGHVRLLGHRYQLATTEVRAALQPPRHPRLVKLRTDVLMGVPHNTRSVDETRRFDGSDYPLVRLTKSDYQEMMLAGMNCFNADPEQRRWLELEGVYYWGGGVADLPYPECLYRSSYLGPVLFLDEPAVTTRDYVIRPRLEQDSQYGQNLTPQIVLAAFEQHFHKAKYEGAPAELIREWAARPDVDLGNIKFLQVNLFTWETMISSGIYQLTEGGMPPPTALVFEPPGHVGTRRTLPELDMAYECQIPPTDPANLSGILNGFLRGAARLSGRAWGTSIYGAVDPTDSPGLLTRAYDQGARLFWFWDTGGLACVPFHECLALARHLRNHIDSYPDRDEARLRTAAEVLLLLPPGYNLGHVQMGKGSLWGLPELNLERTNRWGLTYRQVMHNLFTEVERCVRLGVRYDLAWEIADLNPSGYREIVRIRENGTVAVEHAGQQILLDSPRTPARPEGVPPRLRVEVLPAKAASPSAFSAHAEVFEGTAPVYYTVRRDSHGVYENAVVLWELFGPRAQDYRFLGGERSPAKVEHHGTTHEATITFDVPRPGRYRLRAAAVDEAGRSVVVWTPLWVQPLPAESAAP
jgi:hypothetical protein